MDRCFLLDSNAYVLPVLFNRAQNALKDSDRSAVSKVFLDLMLPLRLEVSIPKDKVVIDSLLAKEVSMTQVPSHGGGPAPGGAAAAAGGAGADIVAYIVDVKEVLLLGTKEALELVVLKYIHGCVYHEYSAAHAGQRCCGLAN